MILYKKEADLRNYLDIQEKKDKKIGFVPTMGALHPGHAALITASKKVNPITVCSIFVNPSQFNDPKDFKKYTVTIENDILMLESSGCDILFLPSVAEIYPNGTTGYTHYGLGYLETILEGKYRPGHFQGVCMVMQRLLDIVKPDNLYLGQKDYQQCMIITKLIDLMGMKKPVQVIICPTLREPDGLAMSSRNLRLNKAEREKAPAIYQALNFIKNNLQKGSLLQLVANARTKLHEQGFKTDYIEIVNAANLQSVNDWDGKQKLVALAAAFLNEVRLIDNMVLDS